MYLWYKAGSCRSSVSNLRYLCRINRSVAQVRSGYLGKGEGDY